MDNIQHSYSDVFIFYILKDYFLRFIFVLKIVFSFQNPYLNCCCRHLEYCSSEL